MKSLKKEDFSPLRRQDRQVFLWAFSVLGVLSVLAVPFFNRRSHIHAFLTAL
jgi:hypothetical protein